MKDIDEQFDEKFNHDNPFGKAVVLIEDNSQKPIAEEIKKFYNQKISEMVKEMIGERMKTSDKKYIDYNHSVEDYNAKRRRSINIAKKYGIEIKNK